MCIAIYVIVVIVLVVGIIYGAIYKSSEEEDILSLLDSSDYYVLVAALSIALGGFALLYQIAVLF